MYLHYESHLPPCPRPTQNLTYEIILTLGQAFEVAYQLALQAQRTKQHQNPPAGLASDVVETRSSKPVPRPRGSVRKSAVSWAASSTERREWKLLKRCLYLNTDFEKNADAVAQVEEKYEALKMILALIAATCISFRLTIVTQLDIYCEMCTCFNFGRDGSSQGRHYLLDSTQKSEGRTSR